MNTAPHSYIDSPFASNTETLRDYRRRIDRTRTAQAKAKSRARKAERRAKRARHA